MDETAQAARQQELPPRTGVTIQRPVIVALLYLLNIFMGFSVFVGLVLAYVWRGEAESQEWERTHYTYLIRTFWIGLAVFLGVFALWFAVIAGSAMVRPAAEPEPSFFLVFFAGFLVWGLLAVWFCTRCILSLVKSGDCKPMPRPGTLLF